MQHLFLKNKYTRWYKALIQKALSECRVREHAWQYHLHHILPRCLGGSDHKNNLVLLTPREHYISHLLLTRMTKGGARSKMVFAFFRFKPKEADTWSARAYEKHLCSLQGALSGEGNPFFGKTHSEETRRLISKNHGMRGRTAYDIWVERYGEKEACKRKTELKAKRSEKMSGAGNSMWGKKHPPEWRAQHSRAISGSNNPNFGKALSWIHRNGETKSIPTETIPSFLAQGWEKGRGPGRPFAWVFKEGVTKQITLSEVPSFLNQGWERGRGGKRTRH